MVKTKFASRDGLWEDLQASAEKWWPEAKVDRLDGLKWIWKDRWIHLRPSNTEPILRIIAEAPDLAEAQTLVQEMKKRIGI